MLRVTIVALLVVTPSLAHAQTPATSAPGAAAADPIGLAAALSGYVAAFNKHDAQAVANLWTPQGLYVDKTTGARTEGHDALIADFRALFAASPDVVLSGKIDAVRMLAGDVAMVDGTSVTATAGDEPSESSFTAVFKRVGDKWLIDSVHEMATPKPESSRQALEPLAWMIGHWQDNSDADRVETVARWSLDEAFIVRSYSVERQGVPPFQGTQVIGWDPRAGQIRSWTFHSDGSFGEGMWSKNQDEWLVRTSQTLPDGRAATGTQVIKQLDANSASVQIVGKEIDGVMEPASDPVTMVRVNVQDPTAPLSAPAGGGAAVSQTGAAAPREAAR